ncbi:hypothetical protein Zmor_016242 [Zophobas morio]|uniref:UDP-glucuronosyltransferase n=1 Tax=Zophobas morio TaxID=2755281 RepID=A0AA38IKX2_9CUCU|nr:hypothetical protein Zmor_016242 [Zophobas morio]
MLVVTLTLFALLRHSQSAKILGMFFIPAHSHQVMYQPIWRELSLRGHQVTVFTPNPLRNSSLTNLTEIDTSLTYDILRREYIGDKMAKDIYLIDSMLWLEKVSEEILEENFKIAKKTFTELESDFDLVLVETFHSLVYGLGCRFKVPIIGVHSLGLFLHTQDAVGNPTHPVLNPDIFFNVMEGFNMYSKIRSVVYNLWYRLVYYWYVIPKNDRLSKKYWGEDCPYIRDLEKNVSLILVNTNPILHLVRPQVPQVVEVGQMHIAPKNVLPRDIQDYLDASTQGVVYFNLGSNVRSASFKISARKIIIEALSELPYNVLWKWEDDHFPDKPKNVVTRKWLPQQDILGHRNVKVFITQGGLQSLEESITNCVPMVGMPVFADQPLNVYKMVQLGIGRSVDHMTMTKEELKEAIRDVAENKKYREKIYKLKDLFSDQPMSGVDKSVWWIEYVLRHGGAKHLRSAAVDMSWFEYYLLDVFLVLFFVAFVSVYLISVCVKLSFSTLRFKHKTKLN